LNQQKEIYQMTKTAAFDVMLNGVRLTTVFKPAHLKSAQVRNQLIERAGYDADITVERLG
jgi:hypothetical protein